MKDDKQELKDCKVQETKELTQEDIDFILSNPVWDFCRFAQRIVRPYSTSDFKREYFIPDL